VSLPPALVDETVATIFESMFFAMAEPEEGEALPAGVSRLAATVKLLSPMQGALRVELGEGVPRELFDTLWAGEREGSDAADAELAAELVNTLAGQIVARAAPGAIVQIGLPLVAESIAAGEGTRRSYRLDSGGAVVIALA
jgi:hypothetical protein